MAAEFGSPIPVYIPATPSSSVMSDLLEERIEAIFFSSSSWVNLLLRFDYFERMSLVWLGFW